jgi:uncharacterized membrane protein
MRRQRPVRVVIGLTAIRFGQRILAAGRAATQESADAGSRSRSWRYRGQALMTVYLIVKWLHVLSSTVLFGFGAGTAWYFWNAHRTRDPAIIASVGRMVVQADWIFTGTSGIIQPVSGIALAHFAGWSLTTPWLVTAYGLYALAFACWVPVVWLQIRAQKLAQMADATGAELGLEYTQVMRWWFALGWPAFLGLLCVFWLMIAKPMLWLAG